MRRLRKDLRREVREKIVQGIDDKEIIDFLVSRYAISSCTDLP